jgi:heavy metal sensor kinase
VTLTTRLLCYFLGTVAVVLAGFSTALYVLATVHLHRQTEDHVNAMLNTLAAAVEVKPDRVEWDAEQRQIVFDTRAVGGPVVWMVRDDAGRVIDGSEAAAERQRLAENVAGLSADGSWLYRERRIALPADVATSAAASDKSRSSPDRPRYSAISLTAGMPLEPVRTTLRQLAATLAGLSLAVWVVVAFVGRAVCRRGLLPVTRMAAAARDMSPADLGARLPPAGSGDELDDLSRSFNGLLDRLQESFERQRRFTGDASHELRTPLTTILGQLDVVLRRERTAEEYRQVLTTVRERAGNLRHIIESLLFLARADADARLPDRERVDFAEWLRARVDDWSEHPRSADIVADAGDRPALVEVQPAMLGQLLDILVDNACKYSAPGSPITVRVRTDGSDVCVAVEDRGNGIAAEDLPHLFTPFYRSAEARRRGVEGLGLGLSIARRLADAFGGALTVRSEQGRGSSFTLRLPTVSIPPLAHLAR